MKKRLDELMKNNKRVYLEVMDGKILVHVKTKGKDFGKVKGYKPVEVLENSLEIDELVTELREDFLVNYMAKGSNILLVRRFKNMVSFEG